MIFLFFSFGFHVSLLMTDPHFPIVLLLIVSSVKSDS